MNDFESLATTKKGNVGESIVDQYIFSKGVVPYKPIIGKAHPFDRLCASQNKKCLFIAEVKSKARRKAYPDTGIDTRHFNDYLHIQNKYGIKVFMFFVDEEMGLIYGNPLDHISQDFTMQHPRKNELLTYPLEYGGIIYFPLKLMKKIAIIDEYVINELKRLTTKQEKYRPKIKKPD